MKLKISVLIVPVISLVCIFSVVYYQINYKTLEEAITESNVPIDEIFYSTENKGNTIIIYGEDDILSAGLIEKNLFGYRWSFGGGSKQFNEEDHILTRSFNNLSPRSSESDDDLVSLTYGVIYDDSIEKLMIKYKDQKNAEATIIETKKGRIWFCFSENPVNYDPEVIRIYKDGKEVSGWY